MTMPANEMRSLPVDAYGIVYLKDPIQSHRSQSYICNVMGRLELVQQEEFGITKLSDSSWGILVSHPVHAGRQMYIPGCQIRAVRLLEGPPEGPVESSTESFERD